MRNSYTAGVVNVLLENKIFFDNVYGVSAGSSHTANYLSRDRKRAKASFVEYADDPGFGNWGTFLAHKGYFSAEYIYEECCKSDGPLPFDFVRFFDNPAKATICAFRRDTGETVYWTKDQMGSLAALMRRVRASSTLPVFMPPPSIGGYYYYDGGLGEGAGLMLPKAKRDGFEKFFIVRTRPAGYRKKEGDNKMSLLFPRRKFLRQALDSRAERYNAVCEEIEQLEVDKKAYVFYAEDITAQSGTKDVPELEKNYQAGYAQAKEELPAMLAFLGLDPQ